MKTESRFASQLSLIVYWKSDEFAQIKAEVLKKEACLCGKTPHKAKQVAYLTAGFMGKETPNHLTPICTDCAKFNIANGNKLIVA